MKFFGIFVFKNTKRKKIHFTKWKSNIFIMIFYENLKNVLFGEKPLALIDFDLQIRSLLVFLEKISSFQIALLIQNHFVAHHLGCCLLPL